MAERPVGELYHTGAVVPDLAAAMESLGQAAGLHWATPTPRDLRVRTPAADHDVHILVTYSLEGPPHVELIQDEPAGLWTTLRLNHIGFWVDDLSAAIRHLESAGYPLLAQGIDGDGRAQRFSYHQDPAGGLVVEAVDRALQADLARWLAGGNFVEPAS